MSVPYAGGYLGLGNSFTSQNRAVIPVGGWVELGRTTLGGTSDDITVSSFADKRYIMYLADTTFGTGDFDQHTRMGDGGTVDTGSVYAWRRNSNGTELALGTQTTIVNQVASLGNAFQVGYIANLAAKEKLLISNTVEQVTAGAGTSPAYVDMTAKWVETTNPLDTLNINDANAGSYDTGAELVVLGWDPADTHTTNFWEELANVNASGSSTNISTGTITAKKYLWVQLFQGGVAGNTRFSFNNTVGTAYAERFSLDGAADTTNVNQGGTSNMLGWGSDPSFGNMFVINNASREKLCVGHHIRQLTAGAANAPSRMKFVSKWDDTSSQITEIDIDSTSGNYPANSQLVVWGSD